jgi:hypothetical protein
MSNTSDQLIRSKKLAASLRQLRGARAGIPSHGPLVSRKQRPNESTADRNRRIVDRYVELLAQKKGNPRGIRTQLAVEFEISRQYISEKVIKLLHPSEPTRNRK